MATNRLKGDDCERDWIWEREVETAPWEETRRISAGAWERQYRRLRESSPFYARRFREAGAGSSFVSLGDLTQLPFTTKEELKQALDEDPPFGSNLCVAPEQVKRVYQTSGTSGVPSVLALTRGDMESWTLMGTRTYYATGIHEHSSVLTTFGAGPFVAGHTHFVLLRIGVRSVPVAPGDTERVVFGLRAGLADTLLSTASFAQYLANRLEKTEAEPSSIPLTHVVTGGEPGGGIPAIRDHIQRVLGVTVTEVMGIGDIAPSLFGECTHQQGMHFCGAGHVWVELIDPESQEPVEIETGAEGELVYTTLTREAMPVVRFRGGDIVRIEGTSCECGRTSFRQRVMGRRDDMFIVRGVNVYPTAILSIVGDFRPRVTGRARVVREGSATSIEPPIPIEVEVTEKHESDPALVAEIEAAIHSKLMFRGRVQLVPESDFGEAGYKTKLTRKAPSPPRGEG
ncbi:MAG: phenylacetate--CoA ligase [Chloroflexi bacterium]|nr:MAG: phenylacetate--CoA ligase [Chloroflexota bacterium]TME37079.1 MAG: phenylacetate--CoA ligase [Chloroflexota bacterium]